MIFTIPPVEETAFTKANYGEIVSQAIADLQTAGVRMMSTIGDNHPLQVSAFAPWKQ
jgi:hypothetical protein